MTPFETLYGRPCRSPSCLLDNRDQLIVRPKMIEKTINIVDLIRKRMKRHMITKSPMQTCREET